MIAYTLTLRCRIANRPGMLGRLTTAIGELGGDIGAIDIVRADRDVMVRDISVRVRDDEHGDALVAALNQTEGVAVLQSSDRVFLAHLGGELLGLIGCGKAVGQIKAPADNCA